MADSAIRNRLLAALPTQLAVAILDDCERLVLNAGTTLHEQDETVDFVVFPEAGVVSLLSVMEDGSAVEAVVVGREGVVGYPLSLDGLSSYRAIVQVDGVGLRLPVASFRQRLDESREMRGLAEGYAAALLAFSAQSTACNRFHELPARLARWLLTTHDRADGDEFRLTHEFLAQMLGAHRPSVTVALRVLEQGDLIDHARGRVRIRDRVALEQASCECYGRIRRRFDALLPG